MAELSVEDLKAIASKPPLIDEFEGLRERLRGLMQAYDPSLQSDSSGIDTIGSAVEALLKKLLIHPVAFELKATDGNVASELYKLVEQIHARGNNNFDHQHYRRLIVHVIAEPLVDSAVWSSVRDLILPANRANTPPSSKSKAEPLFEQTPHKFITGSLQSTSESRINIDFVLGEELRLKRRFDIPHFSKDVFRQVLPLEELAETAFKRCRQAEEGPAAYKDKRWTKWPQPPLQDSVLGFLKEIVPCLISFVEKEHGYVTHGQRQIHTQPETIVAGSPTPRKMDTGIAIDDGQSKDGRPHWKNILVVGELKSDERGTNHEMVLIQLAQYAREVFRAQDRRFVLGFTLCGSMMRLWQFDRSGCSGSISFDVNNDGLLFVQIMLGFHLMNNEQLGFDPTIQQSKDGKRYMKISRAGRIERLVIEKEIRKQAVIVGRATTCWKCYGDDSNQPLIVKDSWQYEERPEEGDLIQEATRKGVRNIAQYYHHETVQVNQKDDDIFANVRGGVMQTGGRTKFRERGIIESQATASTSPDKAITSQSQEKQKSRKRGSSPGPPISHNAKRPHLSPSTKHPELPNVNRIHRRVVTRSPGTPIDEASSCLAIINGFLGAISGHESLYQEARILHRDISIGNIMLTEREDDGFLIDFDLAVKIDRQESSGAHTRTGTKVFMSIDALLGFRHTFMDDLESFFWVLFWICVHYEGPDEQGKVRRRPKISQYERWNYDEPSVLAELKMGKVQSFEKRSPQYTEYCEPLIPCLEKLRTAIFSNVSLKKDERYLPEDEQLYSRMKSILQKARDDIDPNPSGSLESQ